MPATQDVIAGEFGKVVHTITYGSFLPALVRTENIPQFYEHNKSFLGAISLTWVEIRPEK